MARTAPGVRAITHGPNYREGGERSTCIIFRSGLVREASVEAPPRGRGRWKGKKERSCLRDPRVLRHRLRWVVHTICRQEAPRAGVRTRASAVRKERSCSTVGTPDAKEICILAARRILERKMKKSDRSLISLVCVYVQSELEYRC